MSNQKTTQSNKTQDFRRHTTTCHFIDEIKKMTGILWRQIIPGDPRTKKNGARIVKIGQYSKLLPSKAYEKYAAECRVYIRAPKEPINQPINIKAVYYMHTRRRVDLSNLLEATHDILTEAGVIADDNCRIIRSTDGSAVYYDKENPRVEIEITPATIPEFEEE